jgi:hypothetical protein
MTGLPPSSGSKNKPSRMPLSLLFNLEDGSCMSIQNISKFLLGYMASYPRKQYSSQLRVGDMAKKFSVTDSEV